MLNNIKDVLKKLDIEDTGRYDNHFYIIDLENSDDYAKMYTKLNTNAVNMEYPSINVNSNKTTTDFTNYFETEVENLVYSILLVADFDENKYFVKIGEK